MTHGAIRVQAACRSSSTWPASIVESPMMRLRAATLCSTASRSASRVGEVADAHAAARDLVLVGRTDAARGRADLALAAPRLAQQIELAVIRQDQVRLVADDQPVADRRRPAAASSSISAKSACGSTTTPLPMTQVMPSCRMPGRQQAQHELAAVGVDGVPGVVPALIARDDREVRRQQVDDLALAFVAPLRAEHCDVHNRCILPAPMLLLDGNSLTLEQLVDDRRRLRRRSGSRLTRARRGRRRARRRRSQGGRRRAGLRHQHRLRRACRNARSPATRSARCSSNLLRSHAAGVGEPLPVRAVRASMALRANVLAKGFSGIRPETLELLLAMLNRRVHPVVPSRGSVGASGDLAPLAHLALVLIGEGDATVATAARSSRAQPRLRRAGLRPVTLAPKEGLALINGTQPSTAVAALALRRRRNAWRARPTSPRRCRSTPCAARFGRSIRASTMRGRTPGSGRRRPTCSRCSAAARSTSRTRTAAASRTPTRCAARRRCTAPRATRWRSRADAHASRPTPRPTTRWCSATTTRSSPAATFTARRSRIAADLLAIAVTQLATISERRSDRLVNPALSGLPAVPHAPTAACSPGYMMAQVTAAALASELKTLAHPASVDTIPTSANREDHVSMSMGAALKAERAVDARRARRRGRSAVRVPGDRPARAARRRRRRCRRVHDIRRVDRADTDRDRPPSPDIEQIAGAITPGAFERACALEVK